MLLKASVLLSVLKTQCGHSHRHHPAKLAQAVGDVELAVSVRTLMRLQRERHQRHARRRRPRLQ